MVKDNEFAFACNEKFSVSAAAANNWLQIQSADLGRTCKLIYLKMDMCGWLAFRKRFRSQPTNW
jgi:hypothetical protein